MRKTIWMFLLALAPLLFGAPSPASAADGFKDATILVIRHAEKPATKAEGPGLTPAGRVRAENYAGYFTHFTLDGTPLHIDTLVATADSKGSMRPRLTVTPFSKASGLPIQQPFADDDVKKLAEWLGNGAPKRTILIAWHHGMIPALLTALGADANALVPGRQWPPDTYDWVIALRYDGSGKLISSRRIVEPASLAAN
ncbi:MAG TPA: hypothetical protein VMU31_05090 [Rhizomicrobium sp.]|nr:hypothetical protein [Rhizomicrobium sp.]